MFDDFFAKAEELRKQGVPFATATVVRAEKPTSGKPGDKAIITLDGVMTGWIGGSCAQPTVVREAQRALADDRGRLIRLSPDPENEPPVDGVEVCPMTCYSGGTLDVYIEPQQPKPELRIVGHLPVAQALAHLGKAMSYRVVAIVPSGEGAAMVHADEVTADLKAIAAPAGPLTSIVVATHGHDDERALEYALDSGASYVGLISSPKRADSVRRYLKVCGYDAKSLDRLSAPAGLDIGSQRGDEIALSIMAEIVQHRRGLEDFDWPTPVVVDAETTVETTAPATADTATADAATAVDPVCGMNVTIDGAEHVHTIDDDTWYFCCGGCRAAFASEPEKYGVVTQQA